MNIILEFFYYKGIGKCVDFYEIKFISKCFLLFWEVGRKMGSGEKYWGWGEVLGWGEELGGRRRVFLVYFIIILIVYFYYMNLLFYFLILKICLFLIFYLNGVM